MRVVNIKILHDFMEVHSNAKEQIKAWLAETEDAKWQNPHQVKEKYPSADFPGGNIVFFNIKGNHYRLETKIYYKQQTVIIKHAGTHAEYDRRNKKRGLR